MKYPPDLREQDERMYARGWAAALQAAERAVSAAPALDENGYICEKAKAITAIRSCT
jgi:hypothetical protein